MTPFIGKAKEHSHQLQWMLAIAHPTEPGRCASERIQYFYDESNSNETTVENIKINFLSIKNCC